MFNTHSIQLNAVQKLQGLQQNSTLKPVKIQEKHAKKPLILSFNQFFAKFTNQAATS